MIIVKHRQNRVADLKNVPNRMGVEVDLRSMNGELILAHDAFDDGEKFEDWLKLYGHELLILNVKEDGLEDLIVDLLRINDVKNYFFLDQPFPTLVKSISKKIKVSARISEYERISWNNGFIPHWLWIDSFTGSWEHLELFLESTPSREVRICVVSPELQGRNSQSEVDEIKSIFQKHGTKPSAVCTKDPSLWEK